MTYTPYTQKPSVKMTSNKQLDQYLAGIGMTPSHVELIMHPPKENSPHLIHHLDAMVNDIINLSRDTAITIVGDYDADGVTSTSILYLTLKALEFSKVHYYIPHRIFDGYGLSTKIIDKIIEMYPDTSVIMTCDNGISASDATHYAKQNNFRVFITDHHTPDIENLPEADYIVHPALAGYPFTEISGATVAYKVAKTLLQRAKIQDYDLEEYLLQLAAISIVSDVMPLANPELVKMKFNENRFLLKNGIASMRNRPNWHLELLLELLKIPEKTIDETTIGFYIAPLINAVGRLNDASKAVDFFTTPEREEAVLKCSIMKLLNDERKKLKAATLTEVKKDLDSSSPAIIIKSADIHEGIIGIIAGNLADEFQKVTLVFSECIVDNQRAWKASGRSNGANLYDLLKEINDENPDLIHAFGGHAGAAGITVLDKNIQEFERLFQEKAKKTNSVSVEKHYIYVLASELDTFAKSLQEIKPLGNGLAKPIVKTSMLITRIDLFYKKGHVKLSNCFGNEIWIYGGLEEFLSNKDNFSLFHKTHDNLKNKVISGMAYDDAQNERWEKWEAKKGEKPVFDIICEVDFGNFMNNCVPIYSTIQYHRKKR